MEDHVFPIWDDRLRQPRFLMYSDCILLFPDKYVSGFRIVVVVG